MVNKRSLLRFFPAKPSDIPSRDALSKSGFRDLYNELSLIKAEESSLKKTS